MSEGYIKLYRSLKDKGYYKNSKYVHLWVYLLLKASYSETEYLFEGKIYHLQPGQFITGRKTISKETGISETSIERVLLCFENEHQIEQQKNNKFRIISITNWNIYQQDGQQNGQQTDIQRTSSGHLADTIKKEKKEKKEDNNICPQKDIINLWSSLLPELIQPQKWDEDDQKLLRARWLTSENTQKIEWWESYFKYIKESPFLMGEIEPKNGHQRFKLRLQWALNKANFKKINDGVYHNG